MKNQGVWITRILSFLLCGFIFAYMGYHILQLFNESVGTVTTVLKTTTITQPANGVIVRNEKTLPLPDGLLNFSAGEGEKVSSGQTLAVSYHSAEAKQQSIEYQSLTARRDLLSYIMAHGTAITDATQTDEQIRLHMAEMLSSKDAGRAADSSEAAAELKTLIFYQAYSYDSVSLLEPMIAALNGQIEAISASLTSGSAVLRADEPGLFSSVNDGLEAVWTPEVLRDITVSDFEALLIRQPSPPNDSLCRLIRDWTWYYVFLLPTSEARNLPDSITICFSDGFQTDMNKRYTSESENGNCVIVLESGRQLTKYISERHMQAEILQSTHSGVRIPQRGLRIDENGQRYVYCRILGRVVRKDVNIIDELDEENYYLSEYTPADKNSLLPGDEVIVSGKDLYDGKILDT